MALFSSDNPKEKQHSGILGSFSVDVIKWEPESDQEADIVAHRYEYEDFPNGSYLVVADSQMAVFTNSVSSGSSTDADGTGASQVSVFIGPCKIKLDTGDSRFAPFRNITHALTGGESAFHSIVYFINTTYINDATWGTQEPIPMDDPDEHILVNVRANGRFGAHIERDDTSIAAVQARKFLRRIVGTRGDYLRSQLINEIRGELETRLKTVLGSLLDAQHVGILRVAAHLNEISESLKGQLYDMFDTFGLTLDRFNVMSITPTPDDLEALKEAKNAAMRMDKESEALARKREREGYTYQQEKGFDVMQSAASNEGTGSTFMGAGMGLGMGFGLGGAFGQGMQGIAQNTIGAMGVNPQQAMYQQPMQQQAQAQPAAAGKCASCGTPYMAGAKFCLNCGEKIVSNETVCPDCGKTLVPGAKFCPFCGRRMDAPRVCPNCGKEVPAGAGFCMECGTKL